MKYAKGSAALALLILIFGGVINAQEKKIANVGSPYLNIDLPTQFAENDTVILYPVNLDISGYSMGDFNFGITYDPTILTADNTSCQTSGTLSGQPGYGQACYVPYPGRINFAAFSFGPTVNSSGVLVNIRFTVTNEINAPPGTITNLQMVEEYFYELDGRVDPDNISVDNGVVVVVDELEPTAGGVTVGGTALGADGRALYGARVTLTDADGMTRTALTNPFGYFTFSDVPAGESYVISATARGYTFESTLMTIGDEITDIILIGQR